MEVPREKEEIKEKNVPHSDARLCVCVCAHTCTHTHTYTHTLNYRESSANVKQNTRLKPPLEAPWN